MDGTSHTRAITLAAVTCGLAIAACGSGHAAGATPVTAQADQALRYVRCLRSHGVPNFPDPGPDGRLPNIPSSIDAAAPAFRAAQQACARLVPGASRSGSSASGSAMLQLLAVAQCVRRHGVPNFPDPISSPPPSPPPGARTGNVIGGPGAYLELPLPSPALTRAASACGFGVR